MDTGISFTDCDDYAYASSDDPGIKAAWMKMIDQWPGDVTIIRRPEENDGVLYIRLPLKMARKAVKKLVPARHEPMSEERREAAAERMRILRSKQLRRVSDDEQ